MTNPKFSGGRLMRWRAPWFDRARPDWVTGGGPYLQGMHAHSAGPALIDMMHISDKTLLRSR